MEFELAKNLFWQLLFYSVLTSYAVYGIKATIKDILNRKPYEKLSKFLLYQIIYGFGIAFGFMIKHQYADVVYSKIIFGLIIGCMSIVIYRSIIKSTLSLLPNISKKFFGNIGGSQVDTDVMFESSLKKTKELYEGKHGERD